MKNFVKIIFSIVLLCGTCVAQLCASNALIPGIHAIGNGELCVYGRQADILQVFGPPYSAPSMFRMFAVDIDSVASKRTPQSATWNHKLFHDASESASITDFVSNKCNAFVRQMSVKSGIKYNVEVNLEWPHSLDDSNLTVSESRNVPDINGVNKCYDISIKYGVPFFMGYKSPATFHYKLITTGSVKLLPQDNLLKKFTLEANQGDGSIILVGGASDQELATSVKVLESSTLAALQKESEKSWKSYGVNDFDKLRLPKPMKKEFLQAVDDVQVLIKSQQGRSGSVLAGIIYHMGYVRDQYGVSRALLSLGHTDEARLMLEFYYNTFKENGFIRNAQAIGHKSMFHCHENDNTEITGYLVIQAFDYYNKTGDAAFIKQIMPMLEWATTAQIGELIDGMLPFNGDETYIAGGVVPRQVLFNGSAEATLLFVEGSLRLLDFVKNESLWRQGYHDLLRSKVEQCSSEYRENFYRDGKLYINNPARELKVKYPATRPGVCNHPKHWGSYVKTYHFKGNMYFCGDCIKLDNSAVEVPEPMLFSIPSAYLFPLYINSQLFTADEKKSLLSEIKTQYVTTGRISSGGRILGYDLGLFLYALTKNDDPLTDKVYRDMMAQRDAAGAWVEYYSDGVPSGCGCRPWESGINIEAAIEYVKSYQ